MLNKDGAMTRKHTTTWETVGIWELLRKGRQVFAQQWSSGVVQAMNNNNDKDISTT